MLSTALLRGLALDTQIVKASGTIYIRVDGSIDPPTAPISSFDNVTYTFSDNITDSIVVERNNIRVDGAGCTLQGTGIGIGIHLSQRRNVTIKNLQIETFVQGIRLTNSSNSIICGNNITNNTGYGIYLSYSSDNALSENNITSYRHAFGYGTTCGVVLTETSNNIISGNNIARNDYGILVRGSSSNNVVSKNHITNNNEGITVLSGPSSNIIVGNHITNSVRGVMLNEPGENNTFYKNTIANHRHRPYSNYAIWGLHISFNTFSENNITDNYGGIDFSCSDYNKLYKNNLSNNDIGIWLSDRSNHNTVYENNMNNSHVALSGSLNNTICRNNMTRCGVSLVGSSKNNICENSMVAIALWESSNYNTISWNSIVGSDQYGIRLSESSNNVFRNNSMADNRYNFDVWGETPSDFVNDVDTSNTVDGRPVYYWIGRRDIAVPLNAGCVILVNCTNITAQNLNLKNNGQGILLAYTRNSVITQNNMTNNSEALCLFSSSSNTFCGNNATGNSWSGVALYSSSFNNTVCRNKLSNNNNGIYLCESSNNSIAGNIVKSNRGAGVYLRGSSNNIFHLNNFINNTQQVYDDWWRMQHSRNIWDNGYPFGGNYWSDYTGVDLYSGLYQNETGSDGIGDVPYIIDEVNKDNYPLMNPITPLYYKLLEKYNKLLTDLHAFNLSYNILQAEFNSLNSTYNYLVSEFDSLNSLYDQLQGQYTSLNSSYTSLQDSYYELQSDRESIVNELENIRNLLYVFIATTVILIATTLYFAKRKPRIELRIR